ncbi:MAG: DUF4198 domain-containing protein, partial [Burkholderiales bacterium]|nr:DUF4198 domain-containing protein [Burkholderiales bacterium]
RVLLPALATIALHAMAHDLWVERLGHGYVLHYGHQHSAHAGSRVVEYAPAQVTQALCLGAQGRPMEARVERVWPVKLHGECIAVRFTLSTGYWSKTPQGTRNLPKTEAGTVFDSWLSIESVKRIDAWDAALARPVGDGLELVPLVNPLRLKRGDKLPLAVYRDGRPLAGVTVAYFGRPRGVSGADGRINLRLQQDGLQLIQASVETPLDDGKADRRVEGTTLQFELAP